MFQLPLGPWPYPEGTRLRFNARPQWGVGVVRSNMGHFSIVWPGGLRWHYESDTWQWVKPERVD